MLGRRKCITLTPLAFDPLLVPILCDFFESPEKSGSIWGAVFAKGQFDRAPAISRNGTLWNIGAGLPRQSGLMLAARITWPQFSVSSATNFPNAADVIDIELTPKPASRSFMRGSAATALISLLSLLITSAGVSFGAPTCRSRKFNPAVIRAVRQNQRIIRCDVCDHLPACSLHSRSVQTTTPA
jgi:hypothetical protein